MRIDVIIDTVCPWCFVGKRRLERALADMSHMRAELHWRPFQLNPDMPPEGRDRRHYMAEKFGGFERASSRYNVIRDAGRSEGINFDFDRIDIAPNTLDSHRLIALAEREGRQTEIVEALFRAYFFDGRNIGSREVLADIASVCGLDGDAVLKHLAGVTDADRIRAEDDMIRRMGVSGVPCYIVNGKYAVSGAQSPEVFHQVFELVRQENEPVAAE